MLSIEVCFVVSTAVLPCSLTRKPKKAPSSCWVLLGTTPLGAREQCSRVRAPAAEGEHIKQVLHMFLPCVTYSTMSDIDVVCGYSPVHGFSSAVCYNVAYLLCTTCPQTLRQSNSLNAKLSETPGLCSYSLRVPTCFPAKGASFDVFRVSVGHRR